MESSRDEHIKFNELLMQGDSVDPREPPPEGTFARALWDAIDGSKSIRVDARSYRSRDGRTLE